MSRYERVATIGDLEPGSGMTVYVKGKPLALFNVGGVYHAIQDTCPHEDGSLGEGKLSRGVVTCPLHSYEFDVTSGECLTQSAYHVERYAVRVEGNDILVCDEATQG